MSTPVTEPLVQGVRFFSVLYDVEGGIAVFPRGVFEIVHRLDDAYDDEQHAEQREKGRRAHGCGTDGPEDAENDGDDGASGSHGRRAPAGLDAFHRSTSVSDGFHK